jgi:hypothetical protein
MLKSFDLTQQIQRVPLPLQVLMIVAMGMTLLALRNTDPLINQIIYAEDGKWIGLALNKGWLHAFVNAREDYFVWGNILFLAASVASSSLFCGNSLSCLPQSITFWSYLFFAGVGTMAWFVTKGILPLYTRWLLFFLILMLPLGDSANEIIGRISNIGYYCVFITLILMFWKVYNTGHRLVIDITLLLCAATNPVSLILIPILSVFSFWPLTDGTGTAFREWLKQYIFVFFGALLLLFFIVIRMMNAQGFSVIGFLNFNTFIEVSLARSIIYPFVFPVYSQLSDFSVLILSTILVSIVVYQWFLQSDRSIKLLVMMSIVALLVFLISTLYMRPSLTQNLDDYRTTFPDRYFMGINVLVVFINIILAGAHASRPLKFFILLGISTIYLTNITWIFEREYPRMKIASGAKFKEQICISSLIENRLHDPFVLLPIHPQGWRPMQIPVSLFEEVVRKLDCTREYNHFFLTDENWVRGIARNWSGFFLPNKKEIAIDYKTGKFVKFANGDIREITQINITGVYLNIHLSGDILIPEKVGLPTSFIVLDGLGTSSKEGEK